MPEQFTRRRVLLAIGAGSLSSATRAGSYEDFFSALRRDDAGTIAQLLSRGFDPNSIDPSGQPAVLIAAREQAHRTLQVLLRDSALDVDALNGAGESALMLSAIKGDLDGVQLLLNRGARVHQPGWTALHYAACGPRPQLLELLIDRGAVVDARSPNGSTPLMLAAQYGSDESVDLLLKHGADPRLHNERDLDAAAFARLAGRDALVRRLQALARQR
jgi:ankyrin repeat protein